MKNTARQIEAIKNDYTFGVEVEMNHITRKKAARIATAFLGRPGDYEDTANRNGYMTWSAYDLDNREWKFSKDSSIHAFREEEQCELITPILEPVFIRIIVLIKRIYERFLQYFPMSSIIFRNLYLIVLNH